MRYTFSFILNPSLILLILLGMFISGCQPTATPAPMPAATEAYDYGAASIDPESFLTPVSPEITQGEPIGYEPSEGMFFYESQSLGVGISIPNTWVVTSPPSDDRFSIYPDFVDDRDVPAPSITFVFINRYFDPAVPVIDTGNPATYFDTGLIQGTTYTDSEYVLPIQNAYVEIPHRSGLLLITITFGPYVDLTPAFFQMLDTLVLYP